MSDAAAPDRVLRLRPSRRLWLAYTLMLALAGLSIATLDLSVALRSVLLGGLLIHPLWLWRQPRTTSLRLLADGRAELRGSTEEVSLVTVADASAGPWGCALRCDGERRSLWVLVLPDAVTAEDFRRLVRWLRRQAGRRREGISAPE